MTLKDLRESMEFATDRVRAWPEGKKSPEVRAALAELEKSRNRLEMDLDPPVSSRKHSPQGK